MKALDLTRQTFGRLTVLRLGPNHNKPCGETIRRWVCRCVCGTLTTVRQSHLRTGNTRSCGCLYERHGMYRVPQYQAYDQMNRRCSNPNDKGFANYGGRGITVCDRWKHSFAAFLEDMGERPSKKHSLDRIDNDGPYSPDNCRWGTREQQNNNKRTNRFLIFHGETLTISQWARRLHVHFCTLQYRLRRGWSVERTLTEPVRQFRHRT